MEEVSVEESYIGNIETGLSADDSLALAPPYNSFHLTHSLPSENKRAEQSSRFGFCRSKLFWIVTVVVGVAVLLIVLLTGGEEAGGEDIHRSEVDSNIFDKEGSTDPTITTPETSRLDVLRKKLTPVSGKEPLMDTSTPQYAALEWLADKDPAYWDLDTTPLETITDRYIVSLVYFALGGEGWRVQHNFLSEGSICGWNDGGDGGAFEGVGCENGQVVELVLGKFQFSRQRA